MAAVQQMWLRSVTTSAMRAQFSCRRKLHKKPQLRISTRLQVFTVPLLHLRMTFIVGPTASNHFYNARDELMSQKEVYGYSVPTFGHDVVFAVDEKVRAEQFQLLATALKSSKMSSYVPGFVHESREFFKSWEQKGTIDFLDIFNELILFTASSTIMGKEVRENVFKEVTDLYHQLDQGISPGAPFLSCNLPASLLQDQTARLSIHSACMDAAIYERLNCCVQGCSPFL